jgi:hypothetical protein
MSTLALILILATAVPPLTDAQQSQLNTAIDDSKRLEESALVPLLENVLTWDDSIGDNLPRPDYDALLADPATYRGELCLIEGKFAGRTRRFNLNQTGQWGDALTEWVLIVRDEPQQVAVVYFIDPQNKLQPPPTGTQVKVVGRFYKVWADLDQLDQPTRYLTFIARSPSLTQAASQPNRLGSALPMLLGVLVLAMIYIFLRRLGKPPTQDLQPPAHTPKPPHDAMLSQDPAQALRRLAEQRDQH